MSPKCLFSGSHLSVFGWDGQMSDQSETVYCQLSGLLRLVSWFFDGCGITLFCRNSYYANYVLDEDVGYDIVPRLSYGYILH